MRRPVERVTVGLRESVLCRFSDDPHCVLASVPPLALVCIDLLLDGRLTFDRSACRVCGELCIAVFADSHHWYIGPSPHDPQLALRHGYTLPAKVSHRRKS